MSSKTSNAQKSTGEPSDEYDPGAPEVRLQEAIKQLEIVAEELDEQRATWLQAWILRRLTHLQEQIAFDREYGFDRSLGADPAEQVEVEP